MIKAWLVTLMILRGIFTGVFLIPYELIMSKLTMKKSFKTGDLIRRIGTNATYAPIGYITTVLEDNKYLANNGSIGRVFSTHCWERVFRLEGLTDPQPPKKDGPIKSDGGSSSYYTLHVAGQTIETEEIIRDVFNNDFDFGNAFKSLIRAYLVSGGGGKEGSTLSYELNKIRYSLDKIKDFHS